MEGLTLAMAALVKLQFRAGSKPSGYQQALDDMSKEISALHAAHRDHKSLTPQS